MSLSLEVTALLNKALWFQNYKQSKLLIWALFVLFILQMPIQAILSIETWNERAEQAGEAEEYVYEVQSWDVQQIFSQGTFTIFIALAIIFFAVLLVGLERNTRRNDFTFSLPFSRRQLYLAKWLLGTAIITVFFILNFLPAYFIISASEFDYGLHLVTSLEIFWAPLLGYIFFFTFALFIGTVTGEMISQTVLTLITGFLPMILLTLTQEFMRVHNFYLFSLGSQPRPIVYLTPIYYTIGQMGELIGISLAVLFTVLFLYAGAVLYTRNKVEHNGEFFIFKQINPVFFTFLTVIASLFGGSLVASLAPWSADALRIIAYWIGFTTFLLFALLAVRRLITMNVTFRGKPM